MMDMRTFALALHLIPGMGPVRVQRLLEYFATPELVLNASAEYLCQVPGIGSELASKITRWRELSNPEREMVCAEAAGVRVTTIFDDDYPLPLRTLYDPPLVLYSRGHWSMVDEKSVALVGSRQASYYGINQAKRFGMELAQAGVTVISGLARGIDTAAHEGALLGQGRTIAVLGSGLNHLYPAENARLAERIVEEGLGAVVSEFPMNCPPSRTTFPLRNRIVSGWSKATLVIEAPTRSGSLITAQSAADQNRRVFALPGAVDRPHSSGCHELIRNGATLVTCARDVLEEFEWLPLGDNLTPSLFDMPGGLARQLEITDSVEKQLWNAIESGVETIDGLCASTALSAMDVTRALTRMQIRKIIKPCPGGRFVKG